MDLVDAARHRVVDANGVRIHLVEQGAGPLVLLVHGFPESWYSWRHLLPVLAGAGYRAAAIDVRGYGRSAAPAAVEAYRMLAHVADNLGVVAALGEERAVVIGHDWGSPIAAASALLRPDVFQAVGLLSGPDPADRGVPPARRRRGVLHQLLPAAGPGRGGDRGRCPLVAAGLLRGRLGGRPARPRRGDHHDRGPRWRPP
jgi:pimeloyl-ACP methyl ester carboxylesterase